MKIANHRLAAQQIARRDFAKPAELVAWMGAVQAQEWTASKWAVALRLAGAPTDEDIERAVDEGALIRVHAFRWTWQLLAPADVRWMVALVAERLRERAARRHRELELDAKTIRRGCDAIAKALAGGEHLTRADLSAALARARVAPDGQRVAHLLGLAEYEGIACSGARRGKQPTWALVDARIPRAGARGPVRDRHDALAEIARRYFRSRGPATLADLRWWTGLDMADARKALEAVAPSLASSATVGGALLYWDEAVAPARASAAAYLLPAFDEYLVGYTDRDDVLDPAEVKRLNAGGGLLAPCVVVNGRVVGSWRRTLGKTRATVSRDLFEATTARENGAIDAAAARWARFVGLPLS